MLFRHVSRTLALSGVAALAIWGGAAEVHAQVIPTQNIGIQSGVPMQNVGAYGNGFIMTNSTLSGNDVGYYGPGGYVGDAGNGYYGGGYGGYGGYGGGGYGFGYGFGGVGGMGMSLYDQDMYKMQQTALANSRYNLQNAQAVTAYQQANLYEQQAISTQLANQKQMSAIRDKYDPRNNLPKYSAVPASGTPSVPMGKLISPQNTVMWPPGAPATPPRALADEKIAQVAKEFQKDGQATTAAVIDARDALYAYGQPALASVKKNHPSETAVFRDFLNNLDMGLDVMAHPANKTGAPASTPAPPAPRPGAPR